ncbi:MAG TPA: hypothetical protein DEB30_02710 [Candidatus Peribacter riflensis]|uniref:Uncharacterized protein n=1 Tax=Candidatus Peribacter riflensis TaxID=1735162 RepID=A0A0S1SRY3_9BACT|nr:MAG: hypothetical protein PeribacterA2_0556 [Candidatus Peribacter riflensis]OGJ77086.1 MAG: hypothetical protein A2398_03110 [Candidatus Peribacteria bacterium RIFOXYB1_FULL_57_12]ALM11035.1 MAG: hypothetical protein PeribacterB2_0555 [Candidatus Peribacter riflensis]ALM12138.1 MAG: hypothetical protein PeribacterC2_0555 [Candidatus Peribacter riflensis]ALM13241.1 MAG: hypothetical protein PeribacterD1_0556 [Candidatus Peribacter riflensis]
MATATPSAGREQPAAFPVFRNREEMVDYAQKLGFKKIEEFESALDSVEKREKLVEALRKRDPKLNGQVDALITHLKLNKQEIARKERWYEKVLKLPGRATQATWDTMKRHPMLTLLILAALVAGGAYLAWDQLGGLVAVPNPMEGAAAAADTVAPTTGGAFEAIPQGGIIPSNPMPGPTGAPNLPLPPPPTGGAADFFPPNAPH